MKFTFFIRAILLLFITGCANKKSNPEEIYIDQSEFLIQDSSKIDSIKNMIHLVSNRTFSNFKTPVEAYYLENGTTIDSIIEPDFNMISWYHSHQDTISLVAHLGSFETSALLLRFVKGKVNISFFRAPHSGQEVFRINKDQPFTSAVAVPPLRYRLKLTEIPDTTNKQIVFGYIDMESAEYFDKRDSLDKKNKIKMKFYFRSQFRKFEYND